MKALPHSILIVKGQCPYTTDVETKNEFKDNVMSEYEEKENGNSNEFKSNPPLCECS
jgi:hypothetical protein